MRRDALQIGLVHLLPFADAGVAVVPRDAGARRPGLVVFFAVSADLGILPWPLAWRRAGPGPRDDLESRLRLSTW